MITLKNAEELALMRKASRIVAEVLAQLGGFVGRVGGDIDEFTKLGHHLQDEITEARMVPIGNLYTRLSRTARDAAHAAGLAIEETDQPIALAERKGAQNDRLRLLEWHPLSRRADRPRLTRKRIRATKF